MELKIILQIPIEPSFSLKNGRILCVLEFPPRHKFLGIGDAFWIISKWTQIFFADILKKPENFSTTISVETRTYITGISEIIRTFKPSLHLRKMLSNTFSSCLKIDSDPSFEIKFSRANHPINIHIARKDSCCISSLEVRLTLIHDVFPMWTGDKRQEISLHIRGDIASYFMGIRSTN